MFVDCGNEYQIEYGYAKFSGMETTYNSMVPLTCHEGYDLRGADYITCLFDGTWSKGSSCHIKGLYIVNIYIIHNLRQRPIAPNAKWYVPDQTAS